MSRIPGCGPPSAWRQLHRGEVAVDADPETQLGPEGVEASDDAVDAEALLVPVVGGREEGAGASVGVELGDHPGRGPVGEGRRGPNLRGRHQPIGAPIPAHGEEPLGVRGSLEPAQPLLEEAPGDGAVGEFHLLGHGGEPAHLAGGDRDPRRQVSALGLDVDAPRSQHVVVADALNAGQTGGVVHQIAHRPRRGARGGSPVSLRRPQWRGQLCIGEPGPRLGIRSVHLSPPIAPAGCRAASSSGPVNRR